MSNLRSIPDSYTACKKYLGDKTVKNVVYRTKLFQYSKYGIDDYGEIWYALKYVDTIIVRFYKNGFVELNTNGRRTRTTQFRINRVIRRLSTREFGAYIHSKKGVWYITEYTPNGQELESPFHDGYTLYIGDLDETTGRRFRNPSKECKGNDKVLPQT